MARYWNGHFCYLTNHWYVIMSPNIQKIKGDVITRLTSGWRAKYIENGLVVVEQNS